MASRRRHVSEADSGAAQEAIGEDAGKSWGVTARGCLCNLLLMFYRSARFDYRKALVGWVFCM